jgi:hypothetical protein
MTRASAAKIANRMTEKRDAARESEMTLSIVSTSFITSWPLICSKAWRMEPTWARGDSFVWTTTAVWLDSKDRKGREFGPYLDEGVVVSSS